MYDQFNPGSVTTRGMLLMMLAVGWLLLLMRLGLLSWVARKKRNLLRLRLQIETATRTRTRTLALTLTLILNLTLL